MVSVFLCFSFIVMSWMWLWCHNCNCFTLCFYNCNYFSLCELIVWIHCDVRAIIVTFVDDTIPNLWWYHTL